MEESIPNNSQIPFLNCTEFCSLASAGSVLATHDDKIEHVDTVKSQCCSDFQSKLGTRGYESKVTICSA